MNLQVVIVFTIVVVILTLTACHHGRHHHERHGETKAIKHLSRQLDLNESQQSAITEILKEFNAIKSERDAMKIAWTSYALNVLQSDTGSTAGIDQFAGAQTEKIEEVSHRFAKAVLDVKDILSDEQEEKLIVLLDKHANKSQHR